MNKDSSKHDSDVDESQTVTSTTSPSMEEGTPDAKPPSKKTTNGGQNAGNVLPEENQTSTHKPKGLDTNTLECSTAATESNAINNPTDLTTPNGEIQNHSFEDFAAGGIEPLPFLPTSLRRGANHQPNARPGAYIGASEQRTTNLDFSLVGATTNTQDPIPNTDDQTITSAATRQVVSNNQLAVANPVLEDPEAAANLMHANPVDLEAAEKREQERKKQQQTFIFILFLIVLAAAAIVGTVAGTRRNDLSSAAAETPAPTVYLSMEPSLVPSSAPTDALAVLLDSLPNHTLVSINSGSETPQWKAWQWLANHQNITFLPEWRKMQLFAMATFFYSFEGENWWQPIQDRWMDDTKEECLWFSRGFGFFLDGKFHEFGHLINLPCDNQGRLTSLNLGNLELGGLSPSVPPELSLLTSLKKLTLLFFGAQMTIDELFPSEFYSMTNMEFINLGPNLTGTLPTQLGLMTGLLDLTLVNNLFTGPIPSELGLLTNMMWIQLANPYLSGTIPSELWLMTSLKFIYLGYGYEMHEQVSLLTGQFPTELGLFTDLTGLYMGNTLMTGSLPSEIALATSMDRFYLNNVGLTGSLPSELGTLSVLRDVVIRNNPLSGPFPKELQELTGLTRIDLEYNDFSGRLPTSFQSSSILIILQLGGNRFSGHIPSEYGAMQAFKILNLTNLPLLTGTVPPELSSLSELAHLDLSGSDGLSGTLEEDFCYMQNSSCVRWFRSCILNFECTDQLCGCDCPCSNRTNLTD